MSSEDFKEKTTKSYSRFFVHCCFSTVYFKQNKKGPVIDYLALVWT